MMWVQERETMNKQGVIVVVCAGLVVMATLSMMGREVSAWSGASAPPTLTAKDSDGDSYNDYVNVSQTVTSDLPVGYDHFILHSWLNYSGTPYDTNTSPEYTINSGSSPIDVKFDLHLTTSAPTGTYTVTNLLEVWFPTQPTYYSKQSATVNLYPKGLYSIDLSCSDNAHTVGLGQQTTYTITVTNNGNLPDTIDLAKSSTSTWVSSLNKNTIGQLQPGQSDTSLVLTVMVPSNAVDGSKDVTTVTGTSEKNAAKTDSVVLTTTASHHPPPTKGNFTGTVKDSHNVAISGATITVYIHGLPTVVTSTSTNGTGWYKVINLDPGTYDIKANKNGYNDNTVTEKSITAGQNTTVNFVLTGGGDGGGDGGGSETTGGVSIALIGGIILIVVLVVIGIIIFLMRKRKESQ